MKIKCNDMWMNYCLLHVIHLSGSVWIDFCTTPQELQSIRLRHHVKLFSATMVTSGGVVAIKRRPFRILGWNLHTICSFFESKSRVGILHCMSLSQKNGDDRVGYGWGCDWKEAIFWSFWQRESKEGLHKAFPGWYWPHCGLKFTELIDDFFPVEQFKNWFS